jgi:hypothetical protein
MADFCKQCSEELFGEDFGDFKIEGYATGDGEWHRPSENYRCHVLCEGCGFNCLVDRDGRCWSETCLKHHATAPDKSDDIVIQETAIIMQWNAEDDSIHGYTAFDKDGVIKG